MLPLKYEQLHVAVPTHVAEPKHDDKAAGKQIGGCGTREGCRSQGRALPHRTARQVV